MDYNSKNNKHLGDIYLYNEIFERIKPKLYLTGHIHDGFGYVRYDNILFVNASSLDEKYKNIRKPFLIEISNDFYDIIQF